MGMWLIIRVSGWIGRGCFIRSDLDCAIGEIISWSVEGSIVVMACSEEEQRRRWPLGTQHIYIVIYIFQNDCLNVHSCFSSVIMNILCNHHINITYKAVVFFLHSRTEKHHGYK